MDFPITIKQHQYEFCGIQCFVRKWSMEQYDVHLKSIREVAKDINENNGEKFSNRDNAFAWVHDALYDADGKPITIDNFDKIDPDEVSKLLTFVMELNGFTNTEKKDLPKTTNDSSK